MKSEQIEKLVSALVKFQSEVDPIRKESENPYFKSKYADLAGCIAATKDKLAANGLAVIQTTRLEGGLNVLRTLLLHTSGQFIVGEYYLNPIKNDPQSMGSALTYARRYCYMAILGLAPEDDDGAMASGTSHAPQHREAIVKPIDTSKPAQSPGDYVIAFGFLKGKKIKELTAQEMQRTLDYAEGLDKPYPAAAEFLKNARAFKSSVVGQPGKGHAPSPGPSNYE